MKIKNEYYGKKVNILCTDEEKISGKVEMIETPEESASGEYEIGIGYANGITMIPENEIESIMIIE